VGRDAVGGGQPPQSVPDHLLDGRILGPDIEAAAPQRLGEAHVRQAALRLVDGDGDSDRTGIDGKGHVSRVERERVQERLRPYNIMTLQHMASILRFLIPGVLLLMGGACAPSDSSSELVSGARVEAPRGAAPAAAAATRPRIVFLGDSLTAGLGLPREQSVPSLIQARLNAEGYRYEAVNAGVSGDTSAGGLSRLDWSLEGDVDVLVIELGANDGLRGLPPAQMKRNLDEIITRAKRRGITVILTGMEAPPNYGPLYTAEFRQAFRDLADDHDVAFVPFFLEGVAGDPALNNGDGIHPNAEGARIIADNLWRTLEPALDRDR